LNRWYDDEELRRALEGAPRRLTITQLAALLRALFPDRATPSRSAVARYLQARGIAKPAPSKVDKNPALAALVEARLLAGDAVEQVAAQARARFGPNAIGKSSVHRHLTRMKAKGRFSPPADRPATAD
jgi:hypothetical protein